MGRTRSFDEADVIRLCAAEFRSTGYEGTSIDDLVQATGLHRGSLYKAFGSKRGLFVLALRQASNPDVERNDATDLFLVALMELAPRDPEVRSLVFEMLRAGITAHTSESLGRRLLDRALSDSSTDRSKEDHS